MLVLSGGATALTTYTGFAVTLFNGVAVLALFVLRRREPDAPRPFRTFGYPVAPGLFAGVSLLIVANALWTDLGKPLISGTALGPSAAGLLVIALGPAALRLVCARWASGVSSRTRERPARAGRSGMSRRGAPTAWAADPGRRRASVPAAR